MPTNLLKNYPELLEIMHLSEESRKNSLRSIFKRDIEDNPNLKFQTKQVRPIKIEGEINMDTLFKHLTTEEIDIEESSGRKYKKRIFEKDRSMRLHWIKYHVDENKKEKVEIFSVNERDQKKRKDVMKTYIYDVDEKYVIVLEPQKSGIDYYLLSAYYFNRDYGEESIKKKLKKRLEEVF